MSTRQKDETTTRENLRKRGWSITAASDDMNDDDNEDVNEDDNDDVYDSVNDDDIEDVNDDVYDSGIEDVNDDDNDDVPARKRHKSKSDENDTKMLEKEKTASAVISIATVVKVPSVDILEGSDDDMDIMFGRDVDEDVIINKTVHKEEVEAAKKKLSKWAARLFDPDRPRGLVEAPQTIPLDDTYLIAFGKREKEFDETIGRVVEIDRAIPDHESDDDDEKEEKSKLSKSKQTKKSNIVEQEGCKVKVINLSYDTTLQSLEKLCEEYGDANVNLLADPAKPKKSAGRAYITFGTPSAATKFHKALNGKVFEKRILNVSQANMKIKNKNGKKENPTKSSRYWVKNIFCKCFRCGQVGHMEFACPNEIKPRPCSFCTSTNHDAFKCPLSTICFNCGVPGHVSRDCPERRGIPKRMVCGQCFRDGHHRWKCREDPWNIKVGDASCLVCGRKGHLGCVDMKWTDKGGLNTLWCFNCGRSGHHGSDCARPNFYDCSRNSEVAVKELERAEKWSEDTEVATRELDKAFNMQRRGRSVEKGEHRSERSRAKSAPHSNSSRGARSPPAYQTPHPGQSTSRGRGYSRQQQQMPPPPPPPPPPRMKPYKVEYYPQQHGQSKRGYSKRR